MTYVLHILLALAVPGLREAGVEPLARAPGLVPLLLLVPYLTALLARRLGERGRFRVAGALERVTRLSAPFLFAVAVFLLGWYDAVLDRMDGGGVLDEWPGAMLLVALLPYVACELAAIDALSRLFGRTRAEKARNRAVHVRLLLSALMPFSLFLGLAALTGSSESLRVHLEEVALLNAVWTVALLALFAWLLPVFLRRIWSTTTIPPGPLRSLLEDVARRAGFRCRELVQWNTGHQIANAAIVGVTPSSRIVFFTDALLARLGPRELEAVYAHEIGHARHHHAFVFTSYAFFLLLAAGLGAEHLPSETPWAHYAFYGAALVIWYLSFGFASRRFELEADLTSVEVVGDSGPIIDALEEVSGAHARTRGSWRHFSTAQRVAFLRRIEERPELARSLRRGLRVFSAVGIIGFAGTALATLAGFAGSFDADRLRAGMRLGRYDEAAHLLGEGARVDDHLAELVRRGAGLGPAERSPEALEEEARRAALEGHYDEARELVELALIRGHDELADVYAGLVLLETGAMLGEDDVERLPEAWRALTSPAGSGTASTEPR